MAAWRHGGLVGGCVWSAGEREVEHHAGRLGQEVRLYTGQVNLLAAHSSGRPKQHSKNHLVPANNNTTVDAPLDYGKRETGNGKRETGNGKEDTTIQQQQHNGCLD